MTNRTVLLTATMLAGLATAPHIATAQPVTGLYVGGGGGANFLLQEHVRSYGFGTATQTPPGGSKADPGYIGSVSLGYGLGNGFRIEIEGDYRNNRITKSTAAGVVSDGGREQKYGPMANVLFDLDVGSPYVFPYIGAGAGYQWVDRSRTQTGAGSFATTGGTLSSASSMVASSGVPGSFAYQAIAGAAFPIPGVIGLSVTAEYRFMGLTGDRSYSQAISGAGIPTLSRPVKLTDNFNHSVLLGLRYAFNAAPPAIAAVPAPAAPAAQQARSYLVFFDWDRADLTDRARQIIAEAAQATTKLQVTRIEVSGHTDSSGTAAYNQGLSVRRAQTVKTELVRLGVPAASITTQGFGQTKPLVATAPGVREPQNRRVEIVLR